MKKKTKTKETTLSVLKEIRDLLKLEHKASELIKEISVPEWKDTITIDMPEMTMKEIYELSGNKTSKGTTLIWSSWMKEEYFYTKEKTRPGKIIFSKALLEETRSKTWNEQEEILKKHGSIRLNAAEVMYILYKHEKDTGERLLDFRDGKYSWYWTSSRSSSGYFVLVGRFDAGGVRVVSDTPDSADSNLGACLSRRV